MIGHSSAKQVSLATYFTVILMIEAGQLLDMIKECTDFQDALSLEVWHLSKKILGLGEAGIYTSTGCQDEPWT